MRLDGNAHADAPRGVVRAPSLCRVTIVAERTQVDLALPQDVPIALLIPGVVDIISGHVRNNAFEQRGETNTPREWVLARIGQPPLSTSLTLNEAAVRDGELLMLESIDHIAPVPLFDDIMYNVAIADSDRYQRWSPAVARLIGSVLAVIATVTGCFALLWQGVGPNNDVIAGVVALIAALLYLVFGVVMSRMYGDTGTSMVLCGCALPSAFTAGALIVPGHWSWAHVLLGTVLAGAVAALALKMGGTGIALFTGVTAVTLFVAPTALVGTFMDDQPTRVLTSVMTAVALGILAMAPRFSMLLAKLPLPPVPTAGSKIDPTEDDPSDHQAVPTFDELNAKANLTRQFLAGLVGATTVVTVIGALVAAYPVGGSAFWPGISLAGVCAAVLIFRGRTYANTEDAVVLMSGGAVIFTAMLLGAGVAATNYSLAVYGLGLLATLLALALGILAPRQTATPPMRRAVELLEYAFVAAVVPLVCWVANVYDLMRGL